MRSEKRRCAAMSMSSESRAAQWRSNHSAEPGQLRVCRKMRRTDEVTAARSAWRVLRNAEAGNHMRDRRETRVDVHALRYASVFHAATIRPTAFVFVDIIS
jgi:hypothetical protein